MIKIILSINFLIIMVSCQSSMQNNEPMKLEFDKNGLAYLNGKLFSGVYEAFYDNGKFKSKNNYEKGRKEWDWFLYGYKGELIQKGTYLKIEEIKSEVLDSINYSRIEANKWYEGKIGYLDIYIYGLVSNVDSVSLEKIKRELSEQKEYKGLRISLDIISY